MILKERIQKELLNITSMPCLPPQISKRNYKKRQEKVREYLRKENYDTFVFTSPISLFYLTGYRFIATERPISLVLSVDDEPWFFIPKLEEEHVAEKVPWVEYELYFEFPELTHPVDIFKEKMKERRKQESKFILESNSFYAIWGYKGKPLTEALSNGSTCKIQSDLIREMRKIKDEEELTMIRTSAKWGKLGHRYLQDYTSVGKNEIDVSLHASTIASKEFLNHYKDYVPSLLTPVYTGYRGQIGVFSSIPHTTMRRATFNKGDVLISGATTLIDRYLSELERTMFVDEPTNKHRYYFAIMKKAQETAIEALKPGVKCSDVDRAAYAVFKEEGVLDLMQHHTGHSLGMEGHEPPFLDVGEDEVVKPGMVFSIEPGLYIKNFAGFRHSDTIIVTEDGNEVITDYPREIDELIIK